jgi:hypothetical protein
MVLHLYLSAFICRPKRFPSKDWIAQKLSGLPTFCVNLTAACALAVNMA